MQDDQLQKLLQAAERDLSDPPGAPRELAEMVQVRFGKRRRNARAIMIATPWVLVAICLATWQIRDRVVATSGTATQLGHQTIATSSEPPGHVLDADEIKRLEAEADFHVQVARNIIALREQDRMRERARAASAEGDPLDDAREQLEIVACRMILRAEQLQAQMQPAEEAIGIYRDIVHLYPHTHSADSARRRLMELGISQGDI